jgi:hypothetical protein
MSHPNAKLNEYGRLLLVSRLEAGWTQAEVAEAQGSRAAPSRSGGNATARKASRA